MWKDIDISFKRKHDGDINDMVSTDAINNSLENIFKTIPGSRRMVPTFAADLYRNIFDQIDDTSASSIGYVIMDAITVWEDRIQVDNINVYPDEDNNKYVITLSYYIINEGATDNINTFTTILRAV